MLTLLGICSRFSSGDDSATKQDTEEFTKLNSKDFVCPICLHVANYAMESTCCGGIFCNECSMGLISTASNCACPLCRFTPFSVSPSKFARKLIDNLPMKCKNDRRCNFKGNRKRILEHQQQCPFTVIVCTVCSASLERREFTDHFVEIHSKELLERFTVENIEFFEELLEELERKDTNRLTLIDLTSKRHNSRGNPAHLGKTGKFYCGIPRGWSDQCCGNRCGPRTGCNCISCMELDLKIRGIRICKGYLVNPEGYLALRKNDGKFYCGRLIDLPPNEYFCQPNSGKQCFACNSLDSNSKYYASLLEY